MTRNLSVLTRVSSLAIAAALTASAAAESFLGTPTVTFGSVNITEGATTTDLDVLSTSAVIDWVPDDNADCNCGAIVFQNNGTVATYSSASDFAVLNRINVTNAGRWVFMNGTINSLVSGQTGGNIFFYSPSGFIIGANAVINVGSLVLSASPIAVDGSGNFINGTSVTFNQAPNSTALINTVAGSQINANGSGSYVALVAPVVTHHGTIRTDTAAALVAAEAATINFSPDGLFDIQVTVGTDDPNGVHVEGGTITRNSATEGANHYAYLVAVAKNDAVTMLVSSGGSVGFDTATSAAVEDNVVVLSGGSDILNGGIWTTSGVSSVNLNIDNAAFSTDMVADVTGTANINSASGATSFGGFLSVNSGGNMLIESLNGNSLNIAGDLVANAFAPVSGGGSAGQQVEVRAQGGSTLTIGGDATLNADSFGADAAGDGLNGANATGGNVIVRATNGGTINIAGSLDMSADGFGGDNFFSNGAGGSGTGGLAYIQASGGGTVNITGATSMSAEGIGGSSGECQACLITGGTGTGGQALVSAAGLAGNAINFGSDLSMSAAGFGGAGDVAGGSGLGGIADLFASDGATVTLTADLEVDASGFGGFGFDAAGGFGLGGQARVSTGGAGTLIDLLGDAFVTSDGQGGDGGQGGTGTGGQAQAAANLGEIHAHNNLTVSATSTGGSTFTTGGNGGDGLASLVGGDITEASLFSGAGTLTVDGLTVVSAIATGGDATFAPGGNGGDAVAGSATVHAENSDLGTSTIQLGNVIVVADAFGGSGGAGLSGAGGGDGGNGGDATAGRAVMTAAAGSGDLTAGATILSASAEGGAGGVGGNSDGGNGGDGGDGGQAIGGFINVGSESGNVNFAQGANNGTASYTTILAFATATGGSGGDSSFGTINGIAGDGGDAFGGNSVLLVRGSQVTVGDVNLDASATGGDGGLEPNESLEGAGGDATTGVVGVVVTNRLNLPDQRGTLNAGNIVGTAIATGGAGGLGTGQSLSLGGSTFEVTNSDATIASVALTQIADGLDLNAPETFNSPIVVVNGDVDVAGNFIFSTPGTVSVYADNGMLNAAQINIVAFNFIHDDDPSRPGPATVGTFAADNILLTTGQDLVIDAHLISTNSLNLLAPGLIDVEDATSGSDLTLDAGSSISGGSMTAGGLIDANADSGGISLGDLLADTSVALIAPGTITTGDISAADSVVMDAGGSILAGDIDSSSIDLLAGGDISTGDLNTQLLALALGGDVIALLFPGASVTLESGGDISTGDISSQDGVYANAGGGISTGAINAVDFVQLLAGADVLTGAIAAGSYIDIFSSGGGITTGDLTGTEIDLEANGDIVFANVDADSFDFDATGAVTGGNIVAFSQVGGSAEGAIILGDIMVGPGVPLDDDFSVGISSATSITVGDVSGTDRVGFATLGDLATGDLSADDLVMLLVGGDIATGSITTLPDGTVYMANASMFIDAGGGEDNFDASLVLALDPVPTGGSITINGPVSTGTFQAAAGTDLTTGAIDADLIQALAGGLASINGIWSAPFIELWSDDIEISSNGGMDGGADGLIRLVSTNATQALIGDGLTGTGYQLSNAEFGRLSAGNVQIFARADASAAIDMLIGDLSVTGPTAGSTIEDPLGALVFATGDPETEVAGGVIRVVGDLVATGFTDTNAIEFYTGRFELDAATGLLEITSNGIDLSGELYIEADRIHVASGAILDQLAVDPHYAGYQDDLNAPAAVQRPDGVIRAGSIDVFPTEAVLVQNTGTAATPAGFLTFAGGPLFSESEAPTGPIELIINGQLITEGGTLTGIDVRDFLIDDANLGIFTDNSTINGCPLTGECGASEPPVPPGFTPTPGIQQEIVLINDNLLPPPEFGNEDFIDDNDEETDDGSTSPIEPPDPLFDTSELGEEAGAAGPEVGTSMRSNPGLTEPGDVDDPVSGSGNPGLMETVPPPTNEEKQP